MAGAPDDEPQISTLRYSSVENDAPYHPLNLAGLTRFSKRFQKRSLDLLGKIEQAGKWALERWEQSYDRFLPPPPVETPDPEGPAAFRYEIPVQERMGRLSLQERRKTRVRRQWQVLTVLGAALVLVAGFSLAHVRLPMPATKAAKASPKPSPSVLTITYRVRPNDYLGKIAVRYGISVQALCKANEKTPDDILRPGETLKVPAKTIVHTVKLGETVSELLHQYGVSLEEFRKANSLEDIRQIRVGQKLFFNPR